jgi:hypothetical protein
MGWRTLFTAVSIGTLVLASVPPGPSLPFPPQVFTSDGTTRVSIIRRTASSPSAEKPFGIP